jgi:hypothetical protein
MEKVSGGARNLVLGQRQPPVDLLALPWGSLVHLKSSNFSVRAIADPAVYRGGKWLLPIPFGIDDKLNASALRKKSLSERGVSGLDRAFLVPGDVPNRTLSSEPPRCVCCPILQIRTLPNKVEFVEVIRLEAHAVAEDGFAEPRSATQPLSEVAATACAEHVA